jgi:hypothetical protein
MGSALVTLVVVWVSWALRAANAPPNIAPRDGLATGTLQTNVGT